MTVNVRCTNSRVVTLANGDNLPYCGWKGERSGWLGSRGWEHVNLTKPCPRCGGKVALIPEVEE